MNWLPAAGDLLFQKYRVEGYLGIGGMGSVLAARHVELGQRVAIKLMDPELAERTDLVTRFVREGQAAARLRSVHVARVLDVGRSDLESPYLVMEYLEGCDLEQHLTERGSLPLREAVDYLLQTCEAVAEAHAAGIVHRDLKPGNLFLSYDAYGNPCIKVLDFGISKLVDAEAGAWQPAITATSMVMGTPLYMPPEQMRDTHAADSRADIWALGVIFYELVTGRPAWSGKTLSEVCVRVATDPTPQARELSPSLPPEVDEVVAMCLKKDPDDRFQTVMALAFALSRLVPDLGAPALARIAQLVGFDPRLTGMSRPDDARETLASPSSVLPIPSRNTSTAWSAQETARWEPKRPRKAFLSTWIAAPVGLLLVAGCVFGLWWAKAGPASPSITVWRYAAPSPNLLLVDSGATAPSLARLAEQRAQEATPVASQSDPKAASRGLAPQAEASVGVTLSGTEQRAKPAVQQQAGTTALRKQSQEAKRQPAAPSVRAPVRTPRSTLPDWGGRK